MAVVIRKMRLVLPVLVAALVLLAVLGEAARPLGGEDWAAAGGTPLPGAAAAASMVQALRRMYLQQLGGPGASCGTNSPNNGCPP
ncbi:uncharacterized protein LOC100845166 [Brachypodium distachyon]|uniref:Uncharacterized protein n=1 Tax=Brachypodium distachyon TaxID=15368 RepID=I1GZA8_BRADI|nr:uncharacterized protein LOC100845166 [Brachypodium distachyon]KQK18736.1 hypothetical protein BRADI_1g44370v3 [Brachypodium distachyon]|eukprot:XP_010227788.1 uncharacterized protein LOC100845166 [Brachypodium distachyon]